MTKEQEQAKQEARKKLIEDSMPDIYPDGGK